MAYCNRSRFPSLLAIAAVCACRMALAGSDASAPAGDPVLEAATLHSLGVHWIVMGDENGNARVDLAFRPTGTPTWYAGMPLFRVEKGAWRNPDATPRVSVPDGAALFAGSLLLLRPDTEYELRLALLDPDGGNAVRTLKARTRAEPVAPKGMREIHVAPGNGGGSGTPAAPYRGLAEAEAKVVPGDLVLVHAGTYPATFEVHRSGEPDKPIIWRGAGDGEAIIAGRLGGAERTARVISASDVHDVWFENLALRKADWGLVAHGSARIVIRDCHFAEVGSGITAVRNDTDAVQGFFISDNVFEGLYSWPRPESGPQEEYRGVEIAGAGHDICYNRITGFKDGIDTAPGPRCEAIDIHNNDISECLDDGIEMDGSYRNTRCFLNRLTNVFQGISEQPVYGGPVYIFRNALYNIQVEPFKLHNKPSGAIFYHNTCVKQGMPEILATPESPRHCVFRNNVFIGTDDRYAAEFDPTMVECDFDYDAFAKTKCANLLKWNGVRYPTLAAVHENAPVERHATLLDPAGLFASGAQPPADFKKQFPVSTNDLRLQGGTAAVDAGEVIPGLNDDYAGKAPDQGAYELGAPLPQYDPRPVPERSAMSLANARVPRMNVIVPTAAVAVPLLSSQAPAHAVGASPGSIGVVRHVKVLSD